MRGGRIAATQDTFRLLGHFRGFWARMHPVQPYSVSVLLGSLQPRHAHTADLFEGRAGPGELTERERLCLLVDGRIVFSEKTANLTGDELRRQYREAGRAA